MGDPNAGEVKYVGFQQARTSLHGLSFPWLPADSPSGGPPEEFRSVEPLIVPPTIAKEEDLSRPAIYRIWEEAEAALSTADRVYVIGYSFPPTDTHVTHMTKAAAERRTNRSYRDVAVTIVTRPKAQAEEVEERERGASEAFPGAAVKLATDDRGRTIGFAKWVKG